VIAENGPRSFALPEPTQSPLSPLFAINLQHPRESKSGAADDAFLTAYAALLITIASGFKGSVTLAVSFV